MELLAATLNAEQRERLERLLRVTAGRRVTELERLRAAPVEPTIKGLIAALETQRALDHIAATTGSEPRDEDSERLSPLGSDHTTLTGRYRVLLPAPLHDRGAYRALNTTQDASAA